MLKAKLNFTLAAVLFLGGLTFAHAQKETPLVTQTEDQWLAVLKSDAPQKEKADACRELAVIGTRKAVPVLAALLSDEKMNHMARYALETIRDASVDAALRAALGKLKGQPLVGVIGSLGVRHDLKATEALAKLLLDADADVAQAAARALGKFGTAEAAKALDRALTSTATANQLAFCEGLFRCAETLAAKGQRDAASKIYERLRSVSGLHQVRAGALRGVVLAGAKKALPLLLEALRGDDFVLVDAAVRTAMEMPGAEVTQALATELPKLPAEKQILVTQVLGKRGDAGALPALFAAARQGEKTVRLAAIRALPEIGNASAAPVLVELLRDAELEISKAAQESLAALPGAKVDAAVMTLLSSGDTASRLAAINLITRRRMADALPALQKAANDPDAKVRPAAIKKLGEIAGPSELPALIDLLTNAKSSEDLDAIEQALISVCAKAGEPETCAAKLTGLLPQAPPAPKSTVLRVLSAIGGTTALKAVRAAVNDPNAEVHAAAIRALGAWKTADAAPDLLALAENASNPTDKMLCLRSYLSLVAQSELPADQRVAMCQKAAGLIQQTDEKKMLLGSLGSITTLESLGLILPYLDDAAVKDEASAAALAIADKLLQGRNASKSAAKLVEPLQKVIEASTNADLSKRAKTLLQQAQSKAAGRN